MGDGQLVQLVMADHPARAAGRAPLDLAVVGPEAVTTDGADRHGSSGDWLHPNLRPGGSECTKKAQSLGATAPRGNQAKVMMSKKVLIVEDNELNMKLFHDLLDSQGYQTLQTREGLQALALARLHKPDLILMDIQLPEISGLEVTKWLKDDEELSHIPVVAVTAFAMKGDEERIRNGGCEAYISKPISVMHFLDVVRKHLG
jgi:two-component system cell cycle response regulator DivK